MTPVAARATASAIDNPSVATARRLQRGPLSRIALAHKAAITTIARAM
jgi:hypothetical protein